VYTTGQFPKTQCAEKSQTISMSRPDSPMTVLSMRLHDAEIDRDYYRGAARAMAYVILVDSGMEKPTEEQVLEFIEKVGGRRDII
jgi:hypothetical protein